MKETDIYRLQHMLDAAREAMSFALGLRRKDLDTNRGLTLILVKEIEIIGEAASKVSQEARAILSSIEWKDIVGMRHHLIHAYDEIDMDILWNTVEHDIPELIQKLGQLTELH